jgi:hypothetical protein
MADVNTPTDDDEVQDSFYMELQHALDQLNSYMNIPLDLNATIEQDAVIL